MTGIHHTAPTTYLRATRREASVSTGAARRPGLLLRIVRRVTTAGTEGAVLPRWADVTPASAAR